MIALSCVALAACGDAEPETPQAAPRASEPTSATPQAPAPPAAPTGSATGGCTVSGTAGSWRLQAVPAEAVEQGFIAKYAAPEGEVEFSFGTGASGSGVPGLQVSSASQVWFGQIASVVPGEGASAAGSLESDAGGEPLAVALEVDCP